MWALGTLLGLVFGPASGALAQTQRATSTPRAVEQRLALLSPRERHLISPYLDAGPILLVEFSREDELPGIVFAARVHASPEQVTEVLTHPADYPRFMPALDRVQVESRRGAQLAYAWSWRLAVFTLRGRNVMTILPGSTRRGYRIDVRATGGDLGTGRMTWRVHPDPAGSLVVFASRIDMRHANWVSGRLAAGGQSVNRTINIALASVMLLGTQREAERLAGYAAPAPRTVAPPLAPVEVDFEALLPLLTRGDLALMRMRGDTLDDVTVIGRVGAGMAPTRRVMVDPEAFSRSLMHGAHAEVVEQDEQGTLFSWAIPLPLVGISGRMRLSERASVVSVDGVSGALAHGRWRFSAHRFPWGEACLYGVGRFDPGETSSLVRSLIGEDAFFSHGLVAGMQIMVVRSIRTRVLRRQREQREAAIAAARQARLSEPSAETTSEAAPAARTPTQSAPAALHLNLRRLVARPLRRQLRLPDRR